VIFGFIPRGRHLFAYDVVTTALAILIAFAMRFDINNIALTLGPYLPAALLPLLTYPPTYVAFGLYRREWRYASVREMFAIAAAVLVGTGVTIVVFLVLALADVPGTTGFPRSVFFIEGLLNLALLGGGRFFLRASLDRRTDAEGGGAPAVLTLVYGAGEAGATIARLVGRDPAAGMRIVGFLDDDERKQDSRMLGQRVFGGLNELEAAATRTGSGRLLIAMPSASGSSVRRALEAGQRLGLDVRTVPPLRELVSGVQLSKVRPVRVDDLLRRDPVQIDMSVLVDALNGASVVVTGGGGSIGTELVRQILMLGPRLLTIVDNHEWALWEIERETSDITRPIDGTRVEGVLVDVRSAGAIDGVIRRARPNIVFHAAALKHVPLVERFPLEGIQTNVLGTYNVLKACESAGVPRFLLISTDKAVEPVSVMGATKRMAELLTLASARRTGRSYAAVRFGNVLGSSGSVIPTLEGQLRAGLPLTITHRDASRYFMTIGEAVSLILEAGATSASGEIYVLDMGQPVRILDLARDLVRLAGIEPDRVEYVFTGLRPGERLHETLFFEGEAAEQTSHDGILRALPAWGTPGDAELDSYVGLMRDAVRDQDEAEARRLLTVAVARQSDPAPGTVRQSNA
jgi:FlaA1/EpsC-like NDP-sugar epimerase